MANTVIDSLDIKITTHAGNSAQNIDKLADALERLRGNAKLTQVTNNLTKLSKSLQTLSVDSGKLNNIRKLAGAIAQLSNVQKPAGLNSILNSLKKLPELSTALSGIDIQEFTRKVQALTAALSPLAQKMGTVVSGLNSIHSAGNTVSSSTNNLNNGLNTTSLNIMSLVTNIQSYVSAVQSVVQAVGNVISQAIEWDGIQARFGRAMADSAEEYLAYAKKIEEVMGINRQQFMGNSSLFADMMRGFGVNKDDSAVMAVGFTELAYDIWAGTNDVFKTLEEAIDAVRSTIGGETESIQRAGFSVIESTLQETAARHNLAVNIEKATMAEKTYLRYLTLVDQAHARSYVGVYAAEMVTAEGAVRSLSQSVKTLAQAFGSLFIPVLELVIPYITAFVQVVTDAVRWVAKLFGIKLFEIDWRTTSSGINDIADGAKGAESGLGGAAKAAKKLRDYTMGFDELNVIDPDSGSAGGAGGAGGVGENGNWYEGLDLDTLWDQSVFDRASQKVDEIKEKLKEVLPIVAAIGGLFLAWKFGKKFLEGFEALKLVLKGLAGQNGVMGLTGASSAVTLFGLDDLSEKVRKLRELLLKTPIGALILGSGSYSLTATVAAITAVVASVAALVSGLVLVYKDSENFREGLAAIGEIAEWAFIKIGDLTSWIGDKLSDFGGFVKKSLDDVVPDGVLTFFEKLDLGIGDLLITAGGFALFGPWGLAIEGAVLAIKGLGFAAKDSLKPVELFGDGISEATREKVEPFIEEMDKLEVALNKLEWGNAIVSDSDLTDISTKLKSITDTIVSELDSDKNEALKNIDPLKAAMSDEKFAELQAKIEKGYSDQKNTVLEGETKITEIIAKASKDARSLTEEELAEINSIRKDMKETGIKYLSESETESNLILTRLKDNATQLTAKQASETIKNALTARDETISAAKKQYDGILLEAQRLLDAGIITKTEYDGMVKTAETAKEDSIAAAEEQYSEIQRIAEEKLGEHAKYVDTETGEIKSTWEVFCDDVEKEFEDTWDDVKKWWNTNVAKYFTKEYWLNKFDVFRQTINTKLTEFKKSISDKWSEVKSWYTTNVAPKLTIQFWLDKFDGLKSGFLQTVKNMLNAGIEQINKFIGWLNDRMEFSWDGIEIAGKEIVEAGSVQLFTIPKIPKFENGGFIEDGLFTMNHGEIAGKFSNGKSVVANNEQIVAGISKGVYEAVVAAMSQNQGGGSQPVNVYLDGKQIYSSVKKAESRRGMTLMGNQLGYSY